MWNDAVVTNAGKELLAQWLGGGEFVIDSAATGQGTVAASLLMGQTELVSQKQNMSIVKAENIGGGRRLQLQLTSEGVTNAYTINQIGIWARLGNGAAKMIAIFQDSTGISVPTFEQMPDYVFTFYATIQISNNGELVVNVDKSAIVTRADFEDHTSNKENPHKVTQKQLFDDLTEATALAAADFIPIEVVADGTAKKISKENLHKALGLNTTSITGATVTLGASQTYSGSVKTQAVSSVVVGGKTLTAGTDYIVSGNTGTNAGNYTLIITGIGAYVGSIAKSWTIAKAAGSVSVGTSTVSVIGAVGKTTTVSVSRSGNGTIIAASSAPEVADVTLSGSTLTIKGMSSGSAVITVTVAAGTNHQAATCRISVSATIFPSVLNDNSWEQIRYASDNGIAASIWSVGATKKVKVQGNVGAQAIDAELWVYILGFNHNAAREGNNKIHFGTFKTAQSGGTDVGLIDNEYGKYYTDGRKCFNLNHWNPYNYGGWKACDARYDILGSTDTPPQNYGASRQTGDVGYDASATCATNPVANTLMAALPADLRAVMKPITKYTDNIGGGTGNVASNVTTSVDYLPLLAEYEIFGSRTYANSTEQNYQAQYAYFANGNPKLKYRHLDVSQTAFWWSRSPFCNWLQFFLRRRFGRFREQCQYILFAGGGAGFRRLISGSKQSRPRQRAQRDEKPPRLPPAKRAKIFRKKIMSVLKSNRSESKAEFINTANEIYTRTITFLTRLSARYSRLLAADVARLASEVVDNAEKANSIFPSDAVRRELRERHLLEARASLMALDVKLSLCYRIMILNPAGCFETSSGKAVEKNDALKRLDKMAQALGELIDKENTLLTGVLKSDKKE